MKPRRTFISIPSLPPALEPIRKIAYNLHWAWDHDAIELFRRLDSELWEQSGHNPVLMLGKIDQQQLETLALDDGFMSYLDRVSRDMDAYLGKDKNWYSNLTKSDPLMRVAYFSAEFGITECLSIFAGGLGVLAGDHLKSASDLGIPLVGVGLLYQQGYFQQYLNEAGWQQERYTDNDFHNLPITLARQPDGAPVIVKTPFPVRVVSSQVWQAQIGRVTLYLLDINLPSNQTMIADDFARARTLAAWMNRLQQNWPQVWVEVVDLEYKGEIEVGEKFNAYARVSLGQLSPQDVRVELFLGAVNPEGEIIHPRIIPMQLF